MIRIKKRITASAIWDIDGAEVRLTYRREYPEPIMAEAIKKYRAVLHARSYEHDNSELCEAFQIFGGIAFAAIGMTSSDDFLACFAYYSKQFAAMWAESDKCLKSKFIGYEYVFKKMLQNEQFPIKYDFRYILDQVDGEPFCQINEQSFERQWFPVLLNQMEQGLSLANIAKRVGDVRISRYLMTTPEHTKTYLKGLARGYTARREQISLTKMNSFILGRDSRPNFAGGDVGFIELLRQITDEEIEHQNIKFIADNRKEMSFAKDMWRLYQKQATALKLLTVDFTTVERVSMRNELKHFLENRFTHGFRASDRMFTALFDTVNRLCKLNPHIHYFADIDVTDTTNLHLAMEQNLTQSQIMTGISALKVLFSYLCSDENDSSAPKPYSNPFDLLQFRNADDYHENTPYIPETVIENLSKRLNELNELDRLVFEIFSETGMRAKEVAFLEDGCLQKARYGEGETVILKYIPYKTLKARRRNGMEDYQNIYISLDLASKIRKQIKASEELRKALNLSYIFLHQHKGYKVKILNVQYFITNINKLIVKYHICDESGQPWHFTSRQCRKTLAVNMIEYGATTAELACALGHLSQATSAKYYAEVRKKRLAELNTEFYQKAFDVRLSEEQLAVFSEEERRMLYVDFCLGNRRVEIGFCTRKLCEGACKSRSRGIHCVNCPQLCTGTQYLPYWSRLLHSQRKCVVALLAGYRDAGIDDFEEFIEYQQEQRLLSAYENMVGELEKSEVKKP